MTEPAPTARPEERIPPVGHPLRFSTIAHADRRVLGPMSEARVNALAAAVPLARGDHALELGVGKAAVLVALLARWPSATAEGFDRNPWFLADARDVARSAGDEVSRRLSLIETDAPGMFLSDRAVALSIAMGATGILGGQADTVAGLAAATRPGGTVLFADGLWRADPSAEDLASFGMTRDELADGIDGFAALASGAGLVSEAVDVVSTAEWDAYEGAYVGAVRRWAASHPDDPERAAFLSRAATMEASYAAWRREAFGYAIGRFRVPD